MAIQIPVSTKYDGRGVTEAERAIRRAQQEAIRATRAQISEHQRLQRLTARLDKDLAPKGGKGGGLAQQIGGQFLGANVAMGAAEGIKDFTIQSLQAATAADRLGKATDVLGQRFGTSGVAITQSIQQASGYTIDQMAAMQAANQAMLLGVAKSPQEFERLTKVAVSLGRAMGQDSAKSIEDLTTGIGRQSRLILDNLGIIVDTEKAYEKYAKSVGKTASQLTDAEKQQAFLNETLEQGEKKIAGMGEKSLDTAGKVERLNARWADFQVEFGRAISSMGEGTGALDLLNAGLDKLIQGAQGWQQAGEGAELISKGMDKLNKGTWLEKLEQVPVIGNAIKGVDFYTSLIVRSDKLKQSMTEVGQEMQAQKNAANNLAGANQDVTDTTEDATDATEKEAAAMDAAAAAAEKEAARLERVNEARRDVARKLIEIEENAAQQTQETWDDYFKEEAAEWKSYQANIAEIQKRAADEQAKIQKDLAKDLAQERKSAAADIAKIEKDLQKSVTRAQQDQARQERQQARQRQIDAKADERLFQFDMRQLAAEGNFNQIQEAMERREIEKQIEAEKQIEEDRTAEENSRVEIERMRQDAEDAKAERQAQAQERMQELRDQAAEALLANQEKLTEELAQEEAAHLERLEQMRTARDERLAEIEESKKQEISKLAESLAENRDMTRAEMEATKEMAAQLGEETGAAYAEGLNSGFERNQRIDQLANDAMSSAGGTTTTTQTFPMTRRSSGRRFASGGSFTVGGTGGVDSQLVQFMATPGEKVTVQPQGQGSNITVNVGGIGGADLAAIIRRKVEQGVKEYHDTVIVPWSNG